MFGIWPSVHLGLFLVAFCSSQAERISLTALPSNFPQNGSRLQLVCHFQDEKKFAIVWKKDGQNVGEDCIKFKTLNDTISCNTSKESVAWTLDPVTHSTGGNWSCSHGILVSSVYISVNVPQRLELPKIETYSTGVLQSTAATMSETLMDVMPYLGSGTRSDPINMIDGRFPETKSLFFECVSVCASETKPLVWSLANSTIYRRYPTYKTRKMDDRDCPTGLTSAKSRALLTCAYSKAEQSLPNKLELTHPLSIDLKLSLVGLNVVYCSTDQQKRVHHGFNNSCPDALHNEDSTSVCAYVLCDGPPPPPLTNGEKTAIGIATFLFIIMVINVCIFTLRRRKAEKTNRVTHFHDPLYPHHPHAEVELML
uniref:Ig-like domain-containing protein n=1 Tax=Mesocestoides corti TaxID=53468 RepID=A0A5K3EVZ7_MESCO